jgi:hypothetical protein
MISCMMFEDFIPNIIAADHAPSVLQLHTEPALLTIVQLEYGYGGWVRATDMDGLPEDLMVYARLLTDDELGRVVVRELYVERSSGERVRAEHMRRLPLDVIEMIANEDDSVADSAQHPGVPLGVLASHFATAWGKPGHWAADAYWSQVKGSGVSPVKRARHGAPEPAPEVGPLTTPPDGRYSDEWFTHVAASYRQAVAAWRSRRGPAPAIALAEQAGVTKDTARAWVYRARKAGFLKPGEQGRAG